MKTFNLFIITLSIVFSVFICYGHKSQLPKPTGKYFMGVDYLSLVDSSRLELFDNEENTFREITIKVWYPSDEKTNYALYLKNAEFVIENFNFPELYRELLTNSFKGIPLSKTKKTYPVLIFSHGWGEHFSQNSTLMEELASHGYIVFSIAHHFESKFSFYPDGRIVSMDFNSERFRTIMGEQQNQKALDLYNAMFHTDSDEERLKIFSETTDLMPTLLKESPKYWAEDINFFINQLSEINKFNSTFKTRLDLDCIGVLGMSMGGIASNEICISNSRIKGGINIDGGIYGSALENEINTPFMFLNSKRYLDYGKLFVSKSVKDCYSVTVRNSDHYNFTDYALYPVQPGFMLGDIDVKQPIEAMNALVLAFFNKYIMEQSDIDLKSVSQKYDVEFVSNK